MPQGQWATLPTTAGFLMSHEPSLKTGSVQPNPGEPGSSGEQVVKQHLQKQAKQPFQVARSHSPMLCPLRA